MIDGKLFDKIEEVARFVRGNQAAFGGIQLVISGAFIRFFSFSNLPLTRKSR